MLRNKVIDLKNDLLNMAGYVQKMIDICIKNIDDGQTDELNKVFEYEDIVNNLEIQIEDSSTALIALNQPEARDLRNILMIIKINLDLERLGDQAVNIADSLTKIENDPLFKELKELKQLAEVSLSMLNDSILSFIEEDAAKSYEICIRDDIADELYINIYTKIKEILTQNPGKVDFGLHILRIAGKLERVADLSTNIAEDTIYIVKGKVIKHQNLEG